MSCLLRAEHIDSDCDNNTELQEAKCEWLSAKRVSFVEWNMTVSLLKHHYKKNGTNSGYIYYLAKGVIRIFSQLQ